METVPPELAYFVGRQKEIDRLKRIFNEVRKHKQVRFVIVRGDYGTGKSTLVEAFINAETALVPSLMVGRGKCNQETQMNGLMPFYSALLGLTKDYQQGPANVSGVDILERVALPWLDVVLPGAENALKKTFGESRKYFSRDIEFSVQSMMAQVSSALVKIIESRPTILFLDDFHLADSTSMGLLEYIGRNISGEPVLFVVALRPVDLPQKLREVLSELEARKLSVEIDLDRDKGIPIAEYAARRFSPNTFPADLIAMVDELTEGNPLWVTQLFSYWEENDLIARDTLPDGRAGWVARNADALRHSSLHMEGKAFSESILKIIGERIHLLDSDLHRILNYASVIGGEFAVQTLAELAEIEPEKLFEYLVMLEQDYRMVAAGETRPVAACLMDIYRFSPLFTRELVYKRMPRGLLRILHRRVGETLEKYCETQKQLAGQIATHFNRADEYRKSARFAYQAALYEQSNSSFDEGEKWCRFGLDQLASLTPTPETLELKFDLLSASGEGFSDHGMAAEAERQYCAALELGERMGLAPERLATLCVKLAYTCRYEGNVESGLAYAERGKQILLAHRVPLCETYLALDLNHIFLHRENPEEAYYSLKKMIEYAGTLPPTVSLESIKARAYQWLGVICGDHFNDFDQAAGAYRKSIEISQAIGGKYVEIMCHLNLADDSMKMRAWADGLEHAERGLALAQSIMDLDDTAFAMETRGAIWIGQGRYEDGVREIREAIRISEQIESRWNMGYMHADLSLGLLGAGDLAGARAAAQKAVELSTEGNIQKGYALCCLARVEDRLGDWENARRHFEESIAVLEAARTRLFLARAQVEYARALASRQSWDEAARALTGAEAAFRQLKLDAEAEDARGLGEGIKRRDLSPSVPLP